MDPDDLFRRIEQSWNLVKATTYVAQAMRSYYESLIQAGFTEGQAETIITLAQTSSLQAVASMIPALMRLAAEQGGD